MIHFDTSFLVDLLREQRRRERGPAQEFLAELPADERACVSIHAVCELHVGVALTQDPDSEMKGLTRLLDALSIAVPDEAFPPTYARLLTSTRQRGTPVSTMDLLIAAAAVCDAAPLVTGNPKHFHPIESLEVMTYRTGQAL